MNLRAPQAFVGINIPHAAQKTLIQQKRLYPRAPGSRLFHKFLRADFQRIGAKRAQLLCERLCLQIREAPKSPRVGITELAIIIEREKSMCVFFGWLGSGAWSNLPGHSKMHKQ